MKTTDGCHRILQMFWPEFKEWYEKVFPNRTVFITHTMRTPEEQLRIFCQGRLKEFPGPIVTWKDGYLSKSKHNANPSLALDFGVKIDGKVSWDPSHFEPIALALSELGYSNRIRLGLWREDYPHIEVREGV